MKAGQKPDVFAIQAASQLGKIYAGIFDDLRILEDGILYSCRRGASLLVAWSRASQRPCGMTSSGWPL